MYWIIFLLEFIILFFTCRALFQGLYRFFYQLFHSHVFAIHLLSLLFFPGVIVHELAHFLVAELLQVATGEIEFAPVVRGDAVKLGSVQVAQTDFVRKFLIGVAPFLFGSFLLILLVWYASVGVSVAYIFSSVLSVAKYLVIVYGLFVISNTMFSSSRDLEGAAGFLVIALILAVAVFIFSPHFYLYLWRLMQESRVVSFIQSLSILLSIPVGINLFFAVVLRSLLRK